MVRAAFLAGAESLMAARGYIAIDLGAESGRVMVGVVRGGSLELHEAHRFFHAPTAMPGAMAWDMPLLWREICTGLRAGAAWCKANSTEVASVGVDTWGVDFALLSRGGAMLAMPRCYRNAAHQAGLPLLEKRLGPGRMYEITGIRSMALNTSSQLAAWIASDPGVFGAAGRLLFMPDLLHSMLCGQAAAERTIASTSQMLDARTRDWSGEVLGAIGVARDLFPPIVEPGTVLGSILPVVAGETGLATTVRIVAPAAHDTGSAVVGTPLSSERCCYLSSGTWSLLGVELERAIVSIAARDADFTNEHGVAGTTRFHKNVIGLWLVQEIRRDLARAGIDMSYEQLAMEAERSPPFRSRIDVDSPELALAGDMIRKVRGLARRAGDPEPETPGQLVRACLEGLASAYARTIASVEAITGRSIETIHLVGGGVKNALLCGMTASATGLRVLAGPTEATAMGNVMVQAQADGAVSGLSQIRDVVRHSCHPVEYAPGGAGVGRSAGWTSERAGESTR